MARPRHSRPTFDQVQEWADKPGEVRDKIADLPVPASRNDHDHGAYIKLEPMVSSSLGVRIDQDWIEQAEIAVAASPLAGLFSSRSALIRSAVVLGMAQILNECDPWATWSLRRQYVHAELAHERMREMDYRADRNSDDPRLRALTAEYDRHVAEKMGEAGGVVDTGGEV
jgi:hypothetical protein